MKVKRMQVNDPIGDMLTRLRNAYMARHDKVVIPSSKLKLELARVLKSEGYVADYVLHDTEPRREFTVMLKYGPGRTPVVTGIRRVSRPGIRKYVSAKEIPAVRNGLGVAIVSTSQGVMADHEARKANVGGELICTVY